MTLNTDAIRAEADALYPPRHWPSETHPLAHRVKELCDEFDALYRDFRHAISDLDCERRILHAIARENQDLQTKVLMLETRLKAEVVGLEVAQQKRAETREALTKAADALRAALRYAWIKECVASDHQHVIGDQITDAMEQMSIAVHNA